MKVQYENNHTLLFWTIEGYTFEGTVARDFLPPKGPPPPIGERCWWSILPLGPGRKGWDRFMKKKQRSTISCYCIFKISAVNTCVRCCHEDLVLKLEKHVLCTVTSRVRKLFHYSYYLFHHSLSASASLPHPSRMVFVSFSWGAASIPASTILSFSELELAGVSNVGLKSTHRAWTYLSRGPEQVTTLTGKR